MSNKSLKRVSNHGIVARAFISTVTEVYNIAMHLIKAIARMQVSLNAPRHLYAALTPICSLRPRQPSLPKRTGKVFRAAFSNFPVVFEAFYLKDN